MSREDGVNEFFQEEELRQSCDQATAWMKWTKEVNKLIIKCYIKTNPTARR